LTAVRSTFTRKMPGRSKLCVIAAYPSGGTEYLVYQPADQPFTVELPKGKYVQQWFDARKGKSGRPETIEVGERPRAFKVPFGGHGVLHLKRAPERR
jgi:hypothetical protein